MGIMEKKMETTIVYFSCSRLIFPKNLTKAVFPLMKMETTIMGFSGEANAIKT